MRSDNQESGFISSLTTRGYPILRITSAVARGRNVSGRVDISQASDVEPDFLDQKIGQT